MSETLWKDLVERLQILVAEGQAVDRPTPEAVAAALDHLEALAGLPFPVSYRQFLLLFGPGELAGHFHIYAPIPEGIGGPAEDYYDILKENEAIRDPEGDWVNASDLELVRRLILFATSGSGDWFFWDPTDVRDPERHEYGIYARASASSGSQVELVAQAFDEFVTQVCLGRGYPSTDDTTTPEWTFWPAWPTRPK